MDVAQGRTVGSLDRLIDHMRGPPFEGIRRDEVSERNPSKEREIRVPRDVVASAEADGDRRVERFEREQDSGDGPGGGDICPLLFRAALLDVERRCGQVRTVVRGLERHVVREAFRLAAQAPQGRRHPPGRGRHERLRLPAEFGPARVADRMNREARPPTFRDMLRQVDDEIRGLSKRAFEVAIQVVAVEVVLGNRDQPGIPPPPRRLSAERPVRLPRCEGEEGVTLIAARLVSFGGHQDPHGRGKECAPKGFPLVARAPPLWSSLRYAGGGAWGTAPSVSSVKGNKKGAWRRTWMRPGTEIPRGRVG